MRIGLVGYQGSGKSTLFRWLTGVEPDPAAVHQGQTAICHVPDPRIEELARIYEPKKITRAGIELVDIPGLARTHEDSAAKLVLLRESGALVIVVAAFGDANPRADLESFRDDLLIADLDIITRRLERLAEQVKKPRPNRDDLLAEQTALQQLQQALEKEGNIDGVELTARQQKQLKAFQLFSQKPRFVVINVDDSVSDLEPFEALVPEGTPGRAVSLQLQVELEGLSEEERASFCEEMGVEAADRAALIRDLMDASGQMLFFTAGPKEVRSWLVPKGTTAVEAAGNIHTDLAQGFIRAEVMKVDDLVRLGSERAVKAEGLMRQEPRDYVLADGDVVLIRHN